MTKSRGGSTPLAHTVTMSALLAPDTITLETARRRGLPDDDDARWARAVANARALRQAEQAERQAELLRLIEQQFGRPVRPLTSAGLCAGRTPGAAPEGASVAIVSAGPAAPGPRAPTPPARQALGVAPPRAPTPSGAPTVPPDQ